MLKLECNKLESTILYMVFICLMIDISYQKCMFTQDCMSSKKGECLPYKKEYEPFKNYQGKACLDLIGEDHCCNSIQDSVMGKYFYINKKLKILNKLIIYSQVNSEVVTFVQ